MQSPQRLGVGHDIGRRRTNAMLDAKDKVRPL